MSDPSATTSLRYLERLLRTALAQAGAATNPIAGRVVMPLLGLAMAQGGDQLIAYYLGPTPGEEAVFEVRRVESASHTTTVVSGDLNAVAALRMAIRLGRDGVGGIQVAGRNVAGVERCAIGRTTQGVLEYVFPSASAYAGPPEAVEAALGLWREVFRRWEADLGAPGTASDGTDLTDAVGAGGTGDMPTAAEIAEAIQSSLMQMTVDINLTEVEDLIRRTIASALDGLGELTPARASTPAAAVELSPAATQRLADLVATRLAERLGGFFRLATERAAEAAADRAAGQVAGQITDQLAIRLPDPGEVTGPASGTDGPTEVALEKIGLVLSEMSASHEHLLAGFSNQFGMAPRILGAVEHMDLQSQELREQSRTSYGLLQALTEQVAELTRRSDSSGERLTTTVGRELDQFGDRLRHQLVDMQTSTRRSAVDAAVSEEVTRLTRKLVRTEAQLEQILERLQQEVGPGSRRAIE